MKQIEIEIDLTSISGPNREIFPYELETLGFEGFVETPQGLLAYIPQDLYLRNNLIAFLQTFGLPDYCFTEKVLPDKNWNEEWEKNFDPVIIDDKCLIRAPFHTNLPEYPFEIVIMPKMSFGTGHHATTSLMLHEMLNLDLNNKTVLDAGSGTGILAILSEKAGAAEITAIDIDEWCYKNAMENVRINDCRKVNVQLGDTTNIGKGKFDVVLANINLNVLRASISGYMAILRPGGILLISGILTDDIPTLKYDAEQLGFTYEMSKSMNNWALVRFKKK